MSVLLLLVISEIKILNILSLSLQLKKTDLKFPLKRISQVGFLDVGSKETAYFIYFCVGF